MEAIIKALLDNFPEKEGSLIPLLQQVQSKMGYVPPEAVEIISEALGMSQSEIYGVATFYSEFRLFKPGDHQIKICMGTSCYLKGGEKLLERLSRHLGTLPGRATSDGRFSLETVACLGCCSRSPVVAMDGAVYGNLTPSQTETILDTVEVKS